MHVNLYLDINPIHKRPFYVGIGNDIRCKILKRNRYHRAIVNTFPKKKFIRRILYTNISLEKAYRIEKQIIQKCGRICNLTGILANIHPGGPLEMNIDNYEEHWLKGKKIRDIFGTEVGQKIIDEQIKKRSETIKRRHKEFGFTDKEVQRYLDISNRRRCGDYTLAEQQAFEIRKKRFAREEYTDRERIAYRKCSERQKGKTMAERLQKDVYISPNKGKTMAEILNNPNYISPNRGKTLEEKMGKDYILPTSKPFIITINSVLKIKCKSESDFVKQTALNFPTLSKLKLNGQHIIKRQSNSQHTFKTGDIITFRYITLEELNS